MKTIFFFILTYAAAGVIDTLIERRLGFFAPLFLIGVICYWCWRFNLKQRIILAFCAGAILDTIGFLPAGMYTAMFLLLAWLSELLKSFFSNIESRVVACLSVGILLLSFRAVIIPVSYGVKIFSGSL